MRSLREILSVHMPLLLIDSASSRIQVGLWTGPETVSWATSDEQAGIGIFRCVQQLGVDLSQIKAFAFCVGPGSVLGIRLAAMSIRTWNALTPRPAFGYFSLAVVAEALGRPGVTVVADARRDLWHHYQLGGQLRRGPVSDLSGELIMPEGFRHWSSPPPGLIHVPYALADLLPRVVGTALFSEAPEPDAFLHEEPNYVTWTPQIHRAPPS